MPHNSIVKGAEAFRLTEKAVDSSIIPLKKSLSHLGVTEKSGVSIIKR